MSASLTLKHPTHPGEGLQEDIFAPRGLSISEAAAALKEDETLLTAVISGTERVSPELALKIEAVFGIPAHIIYGIQANFDLYTAVEDPHIVDLLKSLSYHSFNI